ncbi:MAG: nonstructural protein [Microviridae sp.]|nr:MAG: nonstructural protein [Microviridae sp.]
MQKSIFSVFDSKASVFATPFTSTNTATATRDFSRACNDPQSDLSAFPEDYFLYQIATFDDQTGLISPVQIINLGNASQFKEK